MTAAVTLDPDADLDFEPILILDEDEELGHVASNDEWAYRQADRLVRTLPDRTGRDRRTEGEVFDHHVLMCLHKMLVGRVLRSLDFPVSTGKEANVFRGTTPSGGLVAVKIYRVNTSTFKHVMQYIQGDERFEEARGDKRAMVGVWAQKEFRNLSRMHEVGASVPEPILVMENILVMEYLGVPEGPWPRLKEFGRLGDAQRFWEQLRDDLLRIVNHAGLVHADLSEYNVLVEDADDPPRARCRVIDAGQAVLRNHPMAREFLARDVHNVTNYFRRQGVAVDVDALWTDLGGKP